MYPSYMTKPLKTNFYISTIIVIREYTKFSTNGCISNSILSCETTVHLSIVTFSVTVSLISR